MSVQERSPRHGISAVTSCLFIVGEIAGTGLLAFPEALKQTGWYGIILMVLACCGAAFSGVVLGKSWMIVEEKDEALSIQTTRNPYSKIGEVAFGAIGRIVSTITLVIQCYGGAIVFLLLTAEFTQSLLTKVFPALDHVSFCDWTIVVAFTLLPLTFLGSPVDFWPVASIAMSSTAIASVLVVAAMLVQGPGPKVVNSKQPEFYVTFKTVLLGISTMNFGFAGASCMPTFQNDMRDKSKFGLSVISAYILLIIIYFPTTIVGYLTFGNNVQSNIVRNLKLSGFVTTIEVLLNIHVICGYLIQINTINLYLEHSVNLEHSFNFFRSFSRVLVTFLTLFIGLTIPKFGNLLNLVGASAVTMQSLTLPCLFYYKLAGDNLSSSTKILLKCMIGISVLIVIGSTASSLMNIFGSETLTYPCYVKSLPHL